MASHGSHHQRAADRTGNGGFSLLGHSGEDPMMGSTGRVVLGVVVALAGVLFTLQGVGVIEGSAMSNTTFWSVGGPVLIVAGLLLVGYGIRGRSH
jgi:hypothetical protein